jgi:TFIIH basal transcription factor complex TTD-A subunit
MSDFRFYPGVLVQCDPSIKSIIVKIDAEEHAFIVEELDDQTLVIKENMMTTLKMKLDEVGALLLIMIQRLTLACSNLRRHRTMMRALQMSKDYENTPCRSEKGTGASSASETGGGGNGHWGSISILEKGVSG